MNNANQGLDFIKQLSAGYGPAQVLLTAIKLNLFDTLGSESCDIEDLGRLIDCDRRALRILCDALATLGLLRKNKGSYQTTTELQPYLTSTSPQSYVAILKHHAKLYKSWGELFEVVKSGTSISREPQDEELVRQTRREFAEAMADIGRLEAKKTIQLLDLGSVKKFLDVGGGPGIYAIEAAHWNPGLQATVLDNQETLEVTEKNVAKASLEQRVKLLAGNLLTDRLDERYDFIFVSNVVHQYSFEECQALVRKAVNRLDSGGRLCIKDFVIDDNRLTPKFCALFAVNMLVNTPGGNCYTTGEIEQWLVECGLQLEGRIMVTPQSRMILGRKSSNGRKAS